MAVSTDPRVAPKRDRGFPLRPPRLPSPSKTEAYRREIYASFAVVTLTIVSYATAERWQQRDTMNAMISFGVHRNFELVVDLFEPCFDLNAKRVSFSQRLA
jgi:hypothetical protein